MLNQAIEKINSEKAQNPDDLFIQGIGDFLLKQLEATPEAAAQIMTEGKTIAKAIDAMTNEARKKAKNNRAMLTYDEGFAVVLKYFGIEAAAVQAAAAPSTALVPKKNSAEFDVRLEDLL